jgi:hypothetical protein
MFRQLPTLVTLATALLGCLSVLYDWAYFATLDSSFFGMLSVSDHLTSFLSTFPIFVIALVVMFFSTAGFYIPHAKAIPLGMFTLRMPAFAWGVIVLSTVLTAMLIVFLPNQPLYYIIGPLSLLWWRYLNDRLESIKVKFSDSYILSFYILPFLILFSISFGYLVASVDLSRTGFTHTVTTGKGTETGFVLRTGTFGIVFRNSSRNTLAVIPWGDISRIERDRASLKLSFACRALRLCIFD